MLQNTGDRIPPQQAQLVIDAKTLTRLIKSILPSDTSHSADQPVEQSTIESPSSHPATSNVKKNVKMRRRASNQMAEDDVAVTHPVTAVMETLAEDSFDPRDFVSDVVGLRTSLQAAMEELKNKVVVTMSEFVEFCERALDDAALDAIMHRFFSQSIMPSPSMEFEMVRSRWRDWHDTECRLFNRALNESDGILALLTQSVRKIMLAPTDDSIEGFLDRRSISRPFGGIGGFDGRGALGFGVMYCIDKKWWDVWQSYVSWTWSKGDVAVGTRNMSRKRQRPGSLSSESLLDRMDEDVVAGTLGSYELMKRNLRKDIDYVLVPSSVWDVLYEMYGGGPPLPRFVLPPGGPNVGDDREGTNGTRNGHRPSQHQLDDAAWAGGTLGIPRQLDVCTHPWVFHFHLCDPHQPYRRGDAGSLSIRVMASPDQPLWRLFSELVMRLPFNLYRIYDKDERGRARIWKRTEAGTGAKTGTAFGPWTLLCKNRFAIVPNKAEYDGTDDQLRALEEDWKAYTENATVESIGLSDGDQMMVECAIVTRNGEFGWPREAAAKASRAKRLEDQDVKFRQHLKGMNDNGNPLSNPADLIGMRVDAMDTSGKWFEVEIKKVQTVVVDTDEEEDSTDLENDERGNGSGEAKQVFVDFTEHGGHSEWIDVASDRLASAGRFTAGTVDDTPDSPKAASTVVSTNASSNATRTQPQVKKTTDPVDSNAKLCSIPGYGACGLVNLGNTCYANSAIQCVSYLPILRAYLLSLQYKSTGDLNRDNPLGTEGKLLEELADLLRQMWSAKIGEKSPMRFRFALGKANELFHGADQQDSQEFLSFILDVLHEDSNRVRRKPVVQGVEDEWKKITNLPRVGEEEWHRYVFTNDRFDSRNGVAEMVDFLYDRFLRRNRSIMADVGMGQVLNLVTCPVCSFSSRNFDPFNLLSVPFPTVADVIFKCLVVRRASASNIPWVLNKPRKGDKSRIRFQRKEHAKNSKLPSDGLVVEEYIVAMSRVADSSDLELQIQNLTEIPASSLIICKGEVVSSKDIKNDAIVGTHTQVTVLTDKEGPCSQLANRKRANSEDMSSLALSPPLIVAFESTIRPRPRNANGKEDLSDSIEENDHAEKTLEPNKEELKELEKHVELYGNAEECRLYDTETLLIAKAVSRSLWPRTEGELPLGLRVDAIDQKNNWFPGSVVEIIEGSPSQTGGEGKDMESAPTKVRVHFDNFSSKWDETYTIEDFQQGKVKPLFSNAQPRLKPTEFVVHHRFMDRTSRISTLFGQSFYVQCSSEWTTARAGAQILAQAARFLQLPPEHAGGTTDRVVQEREAKIQRLYDRTQGVISDLIDVLIDCDREYIHGALGVSDDPLVNPPTASKKFRNPGFDSSVLSQNLIKKVGALTSRLPFEVRVCTVDSTLGGNNEEITFPFSLMRTIGNYMSGRHAIVLQWREPPSDKQAANVANANYVGAPVMYVPPTVVVDDATASILANHKSNKASKARGGGGIPLGVCLTEYCKLQQLPTWRCPKCKDFRDGHQNMTLWRLPDLLTIHLKRFNCSARWREKITTKVNFPLTGFDLREWCHSESPVILDDCTGDACVYDLVGVLNHYGGMTGGHYVATCKASPCGRDGSEEVAYGFNGVGASKPTFPDSENEYESQPAWKFGRQKNEVNQKRVSAMITTKAASESSEPLWLQFDDDLVEPIHPRHVVSETAYVLFYRRRRITPANIARYSALE